MSHALLLVPDFLLILFGFMLCRWTALGRSVWDGVERLVYYVLFPVLLFNSIVKSPLQPGTTIGLALGGSASWPAASRWPMRCGCGPASMRGLHASGAQTAFRFNSFIGLALAERLAGPQGLAWVALLIALCVPLCNVAAVWPLARHGGHAYWPRDRAQPADPEHRGRSDRQPRRPALARRGGHRAAAHRPGRTAAGPDGGGRRA